MSHYKIPGIFLFLFGLFTLGALYPEMFSFRFSNSRFYRFYPTTFRGFFSGDSAFFQQHSQSEAEKEIVQMFPEKLQKKVAHIIRPVLVLCEKYQVDPFWVLSVMWTESHFKHESTSFRGARGLMQLMPKTYLETLAEMKKREIFLESEQSEDYLRYQYQDIISELGTGLMISKLKNLEVGIFYLKGLLSTFEYNYRHATVAYNMGPYWTRMRLKNNAPVGEKNKYLTKVLQNYYSITKTLSPFPKVTFAK